MTKTVRTDEFSVNTQYKYEEIDIYDEKISSCFYIKASSSCTVQKLQYRPPEME